jgi:hypothetical protein
MWDGSVDFGWDEPFLWELLNMLSFYVCEYAVFLSVNAVIHSYFEGLIGRYLQHMILAFFFPILCNVYVFLQPMTTANNINVVALLSCQIILSYMVLKEFYGTIYRTPYNQVSKGNSLTPCRFKTKTKQH